MSEVHREYYLALERLVNGNSKVVKSGARITNDAVAIEAGRKKGSIKKSRASFHGLINAIQLAKGNSVPADPLLSKVQSTKEQKQQHKLEEYRRLYEESLGREVMLIKQIHELQKQLKASRAGVISILKKK